ncbi:MAG: class I SAM-dependent methyltransferase [Candidatus Daviesbacteria bacterium]|nr:class I SAM-dependent methyltransferase [Candidatus Daviesbacteria bacterium]
MIILKSPVWSDYELLDSGNGQRLERFGQYILTRPDPQIIWQPHLSKSEWEKADAVFDGNWKIKTEMPDKWVIKYRNINLYCKLSPFKHTGVFPEQAANWDWIRDVILGTQSEAWRTPESKKDPGQARMTKTQPNILNLFGYTGIASLVAAANGAKVTHIDASYPTIGWARENQTASGLDEKPIRWILDDALKFVEREIKRGVKYDGILMDPPVYGHGPKGEVWDFNKSFPVLMEACMKILSDKPLFILVNAYAISTSSLTLENVLADFTKSLGGKVESGELVLQEKSSERLLSTGIFARWSKDEAKLAI